MCAATVQINASTEVDMSRIYNVRVYGLEESLKASGYPMKEDKPEEFSNVIYMDPDENNPIETCFAEEEEREKAIERAIKLGTAPTGSGHDNYLCGIVVQFDLEYTQYFTPQFQRYHFASIVSSQSKMHRLVKMDIEKNCNKYVDQRVISNLKYWVNLYNHFDEIWAGLASGVDGNEEDFFMKEENGKEVKAIYPPMPRCQEEMELFTKHELYMKAISNCPLGFMITMRVTTNYQQLKTMYLQRRTHKMWEDWGPVCDFIEELPMFKELCLKNG